MFRPLLVTWLVLLGSGAVQAQTLSILRIKAGVTDAEGRAVPVARHVLLVGDEPPTAAPRAIVTTREGTANVRLRPGHYTVESERPIAFQGKVYQWTKQVDITAGSDAVLELTAGNADIESAAPDATPAAPVANDPSFLLPQWQASVVALWTPTTHASGFAVDERGLIATSQRGVGTATTVEVQLTPQLKVTARVLVADPARDVALLWIDRTVAASMRPLPLGCAQTGRPPLVEGQELFTIGAPLRDPKGMTVGTVSRVEPRSIAADFRLPTGSAGGPVFAAGGAVVGLTSVAADEEARRDDASRVVRVDDVCDLMASAEKQMQGVSPPSEARLPVEPVRPFPTNALEEAARRNGGSPSPPQLSSSDFDVTFITPVLRYQARARADRAPERGRNGEPGGSGGTADALRPLREFSNWSDYVADAPPVLLIRVTPKLVERFWTTVARGAARTQGVSLPPIKRLAPGFAKMRVTCGGAEVTPIHPFMLEQRATATEAIHEGLYVFDPGALGPQCGTVELVLFSEKEPGKGDTRRVGAAILQRIWQDFAPYRALANRPAEAAGAVQPDR